jgi:predicted enzyme related to lactoylglutathione lyase
MSGNSLDNGRFVWYEYLAKDPNAAIDFYTDVAGWKTQPFGEGGDYVMWVGNQGPLGGVMKLPDAVEKMGVPPHWMAHVQVENVDAAVSRVKALGGKIHKEPEDIPTVGSYAVIGDPQGAFISIFSPSAPMTLHDTSKDGEFCWNELMTSDFAAAFDFYSQIFGWKVAQDMDMGPMGTYRVFAAGDRQLGGMMTLPKGAPMPPAWLYYTEIPNVEAGMGRATKKGAKVMNGPMDVPGGGRIVQLMDPQGAAFALHQAAKKM